MGIVLNMAHEFEWEAPEFRYYEKDTRWFWTSVFVAALLVVAALWQKNFLFAIFVVIAEFVVLRHSNELPRMVRFKVNKQGIEIGGAKIYPHESLESFSVYENENDALGEIVLRAKSKFTPVIKLHIYADEVKNAKETLQNFLPETEFEDSVIDAIAKLARF